MSTRPRLQFAGQGDDGAVGTKKNPIMFFDAKNGNGPYFHVCGGRQAAQWWLDRQLAIGGIDAKERAVVERMIADLDDEAVADAAYNSILPPEWNSDGERRDDNGAGGVPR
jgi:hypothetical protein